MRPERIRELTLRSLELPWAEDVYRENPSWAHVFCGHCGVMMLIDGGHVSPVHIEDIRVIAPSGEVMECYRCKMPLPGDGPRMMDWDQMCPVCDSPDVQVNFADGNLNNPGECRCLACGEEWVEDPPI